ncbi:MAG: histidine phosphatase family protein [Oscillospiraceae bacterium]
MQTYKIHIIRHGLTRANTDGLYCGRTDVPLCTKGRQELCDILGEYCYPCPDIVYTSPLLRARETVEILFPECEVAVRESLTEADFGPFDGRALEELKTDPDFQKWVTPGSGYLPAGVEPPGDFVTRCSVGFADIVTELMRNGMHTCAIVTHSGVIASILASLAYPKRAPHEWTCDSGFGYTVLADPSLFLRDPVVEVVGYVPLPADEQDLTHEVDEDLIY